MRTSALRQRGHQRCAVAGETLKAAAAAFSDTADLVLEGAGWSAPGCFGMMEPAETSDRRGEGGLVDDLSLERNKAVVRRWIELWNERGADGVDEVFAADFRDAQLEQRSAAPLTLELFKESLRALEAAIGHARFEERELLAEGDRVMVRWTMHATHQGPFWGLQPTGRRFALDGVNVFRVENGRIAERLSYVDAASLLAQLG